VAGAVNVVGLSSVKNVAVLGEETKDLSPVKIDTPNEEDLDISVDLFTVQL
jgi:hypothetical protein